MAVPSRATHQRWLTKRLRRKRLSFFSAKFSESMRNVLRLSTLMPNQGALLKFCTTRARKHRAEQATTLAQRSLTNLIKAALFAPITKRLDARIEVWLMRAAQCDRRSSEGPDDARSPVGS